MKRIKKKLRDDDDSRERETFKETKTYKKTKPKDSPIKTEM